MGLRLKNLRAVVPGGTKGIGRPIMETLAGKGVDGDLRGQRPRMRQSTSSWMVALTWGAQF
jgi:hypothetical protein